MGVSLNLINVKRKLKPGAILILDYVETPVEPMSKMSAHNKCKTID